eukprot:2336268-Amphidinium_carterae.2
MLQLSFGLAFMMILMSNGVFVGQESSLEVNPNYINKDDNKCDRHRCTIMCGFGNILAWRIA